MLTITNEEARRFILRKQGLLGEKLFSGEDGAITFVRQAGCVQYDPVDVCGRSPELSFLCRVEGFTKETYHSMLYERRALVDYIDKNLAILPAEDWKYFARHRAYHASPERRSYQATQALAPAVRAFLRENGPSFSEDLPDLGRVDWYWTATSGARAAMESMYFQGELCVHHKQGTRRCFDFAENCLPAEILSAPDPYPNDDDFRAFLLKRRIGAVGMLWNKASDAWLGVPDFKQANREKAFAALENAGEILPIKVEGITPPLCILASDEPLLRECQTALFTPRSELIPPLDALLWDRKLIEALFGFHYRWEIYTPKEKREFGHYVLPLLQGERFVGRLEAVRDAGESALVVRNVWREEGARLDKRALNKTLCCLCRFLGMKTVQFLS